MLKSYCRISCWFFFCVFPYLWIREEKICAMVSMLLWCCLPLSQMGENKTCEQPWLELLFHQPRKLILFFSVAVLAQEELHVLFLNFCVFRCCSFVILLIWSKFWCLVETLVVFNKEKIALWTHQKVCRRAEAAKLAWNIRRTNIGFFFFEKYKLIL